MLQPFTLTEHDHTIHKLLLKTERSSQRRNKHENEFWFTKMLRNSHERASGVPAPEKARRVSFVPEYVTTRTKDVNLGVKFEESNSSAFYDEKHRTPCTHTSHSQVPTSTIFQNKRYHGFIFLILICQ